MTNLPEKLIVLDTLNLSDCVNLKELPENFYLIGTYTSPSYTGPKIKYLKISEKFGTEEIWMNWMKES